MFAVAYGVMLELRIMFDPVLKLSALTRKARNLTPKSIVVKVVDVPEGSADVEFWASTCLASRQNHRFPKADEDPVDSRKGLALSVRRRHVPGFSLCT
jgi:hypothetical protein